MMSFKHAEIQSATTKPARTGRWILGTLGLFFAALCLAGIYLHSAPRQTELPRAFTIEPGTSVSEITKQAKRDGFVRSSLLLYAVLARFYESKTLYAGTYLVVEPLSTSEFAAKLAGQDIVIDTVAVTIPEGVRARMIGALAAEVLEDFDATTFTTLAEPREGYLFPETYHVPQHFSETELFELLQDTFVLQTADVQSAMQDHDLGEYGVLTLASIIEREANDEASMRMVSGILQNRLAIDMALQTDASIEYDLDKPLAELTPEDLEQDSPYNTYRNRELPPTPIGNPGLMAIEAVLDPTPSEYLYYITGLDGAFYYARTFDEHRKNIDRYLR